MEITICFLQTERRIDKDTLLAPSSPVEGGTEIQTRQPDSQS